MRIGRTRRRAQRRIVGVNIPIDRRSIERRTQDLLGQPIRCARFRADLTAVTRVLARRRLDLLPMLLNVARGEMALVGPLPEVEERVLRWKDSLPDYERRFTVLPGLIGLAQVASADSGGQTVERRLEYDLFYVDHRSLLLDVRTLSRTAALILRPSLLTPARNGTGAGWGLPVGASTTSNRVPAATIPH